MRNKKKDRRIAVFSFFSGAGFLDLGFEKVGFDVVYVNEYYEPFLKAYRFARKNMSIPEPEYGYSYDDITNLTRGRKSSDLTNKITKAKEKYSLVGFIGGPPCPDFSVAGKNKGRYGQNGILSKVYVDIIVKQKPDFFLFENVKGLWNTKKHREFYEELKGKLRRAGYLTSERLVNAIEYGVPQDRWRIILVGFKKKAFLKIETSGKSHSDEDLFSWKEFVKYDRDAVFKSKWPEQSRFSERNKITLPKGLISELTIEHWFQTNDVEQHLNAQDCFKPKAGLKKFLSVDEGDVSRKSYKRLHRWKYSPTAAYGNNEVHLHPYKPRRLTIAETLAIQSMPKNFVLPKDMTLTDKFKSVGNGVPFLAAKGIASMIKSFIEGNI